MHVGYKPLKFDVFGGTCNPHAHLSSYYNKLIGVGRNMKLIMKIFIRSLTRDTDNFMNYFRFNVEITLARFAQVNMQKKPSGSFQEYACRWRNEAARAQPPLDDNEMT